jgi:hypothetical protein
MRTGAALLLLLSLAACGGRPDAGYEAEVAALADQSPDLTPGLVSCLLAIGRPDLADDPAGDMDVAEIEALLSCTAERARG